ncbi:MAG: TldD/PmbA family protein [Pseudanabaenaceae cyanobacterium]
MIEHLAKLLNNLQVSAEWVGIREVEETQTVCYVRDGQPQSSGKRISHGAMVEVLVNGQFAYASTTDLSLEGLQRSAEQAYKLALVACRWSIFPFSVEHRPVAKGSYHSPTPQKTYSLGELHEILQQVCQALKVSGQIVQTSAYASITETKSHLVSSTGTDIYQHFHFVATDYSATAQDGTLVQRRGDHGQLACCYQGEIVIQDLPNLLQRVRMIGEQAVELLTAEECPNTTTNLVLAPDQMLLQIHESIGHPLELDRILGDERNYAGGSFVKLSDFGHLVYGSPLLNVTFDPDRWGQFASYAYDDLGVKAEKVYLIKEGVLLRGLGSIESQARSGIPGTANARACSWNRPPIDRMANINLEAGVSSWSEIISQIEYGVYMEANRSWSIDDYRNKFQFGCEYGKLIENGKLTKTVRNPNYRGMTLPFWRSLKAVGNEATVGSFGSPFCGKGEPNQAIRVGHASPVCWFENVEVFGGA